MLQELDDTWNDFLLRNEFLETKKACEHEDKIKAEDSGNGVEYYIHMADT